MSDIPEDIMQAACEVHEQLQKIGAIPDDTTDDAPAVYTIARAILAERQRCADVAEGFRQAHDTGSGFDSQPARQTAAAIRDAILA